jgi:hypothetical protein
MLNLFLYSNCALLIFVECYVFFNVFAAVLFNRWKAQRVFTLQGQFVLKRFLMCPCRVEGSKWRSKERLCLYQILGSVGGEY